jgi:hypothetical protein
MAMAPTAVRLNIEHYWPDVPPRAFTILREIAQERQRQAEWDESVGKALPVNGETLTIIASILCDSHAPRGTLITCAALLVRELERRDGSVNG